MPRLSKKEREEVTELIKNGYTLRAIARKMNTSHSTIHRLLKKHEETGSIDDRPRSGRPKIMPVRESSWFHCVGLDRPFVCTECSKTFKKMTGLKNHIKIHGLNEGDKVYQCDQCGRSFYSSASFMRHQRTHTGEKPYICEYCARGFADLVTMKTHIRTHTGERPHKCHLCDHACTTAGNLHAHMKVHRDKQGQIPWPINVKPSLAKSVPIFPGKKMLRRAKRSHEKYSGECCPDANDSLGMESEPTSNQDESMSKKLYDKVKDEVELKAERDMFTYRTCEVGSHEQCQDDSSRDSYEVLVQQDLDDDVSDRVAQLVHSDDTASMEEEHYGQEEEACVSEKATCIQEEEIKKEPTSSDEG